MVAAIAVGLILSTPSNWTSWKLRVGRPPNSCIVSIIALVPSSVSSLRPSFSANSLWVSRTTSMKRSGSSTRTPTVPCTATALRFLEPITAPTPERPAARWRSLMMHAKRTPRSPATPIEATFSSGFWCCAFSASSVCQTVSPHSSPAGRISTWSSTMWR